MATTATTSVSIILPSDLTPPLTPAKAGGGSATPGECKILRLKRKRNEEPLDGLRRYFLTRRSGL